MGPVVQVAAAAMFSFSIVMLVKTILRLKERQYEYELRNSYTDFDHRMDEEFMENEELYYSN